MSTFFVTGATGGQGGAAVRHLLKQGHKVHAFVRDPSKPQAQELEKLGAKLIKGDFDDVDAIKTGVRGCDGIFLNTMPSYTTADAEPKQASNVIEAAKAAGTVKVLVASTSTRSGEHESFKNWDPNGPRSMYWLSKAGVQDKVKQSGIAHWTILQPAWLMTNWVAPVSLMLWPKLPEGLMEHCYGEETKVPLCSPDDCGAFAAAALTGAGGIDKWDGKIMYLASDPRNMDEMAKDMSEVSGKHIVAKQMSDEETKAVLEKNPGARMMVWTREDGPKIDYDKIRSYGVQMTTYKEFLEKNKQALMTAIGQ